VKKGTAIRASVLTALLVLVMGLGSRAEAAFIRAEPDDYAENSVIPDSTGVMLRNADYPPGHAEFNRSWRRIYAKATDSYVQCGPSTGSLVLGNDTCHYYNGPNYGLRGWFSSPTNYVGFDICWSAQPDWSEGALVEVWGTDIGGSTIRIVYQGFRPSGRYTSFSLFYPGITVVRITCWDDPRYARQKAFSIDDFQFVDTSGTAFAVAPGETLTAPNGMALGADDSLSGEGTVDGDVSNGGVVSPGSSPGTLSIAGDYTQTAGGECVIELGGTAPGQFDVLAVTGTAQLAGRLTIQLDTFTPALADEFLVMTYASRIGEFDDVVPPAGVAFDLDYGAAGLTLTVVPEPAALALLALGGVALIWRRR